MGVKRPLEQLYYPGLSFKQPKQLDYGKRLTLHTKDFPSHKTTALVESPGEANSNFCKLHSDGTLSNDDTVGATLANKKLEASVPSSLPASGSSEDDTGSEDSFWSCVKEKMGVKRPLQQLYCPGISFKQPKQLDYGKRLTLCTEDFPSHETTALVDSPGEAKSNFCKLHSDGTLENGDTDGATLANKELEASVPSSLSTSSGSEDDSGSEDSFWSCVDFTLPRRPSEEFEDPSVSFLNCSLKEVLIGPDHQAIVPQWNPDACRKEFSGSNCFVDNDRDNKLMGTCVISMPDLNDPTIDGARVGCGRTDCSCLDVGSMRCIQQHVTEARENYLKALGEDKFKELGFYEMGEEVASKWTAVDENIFHQVIFSNPVSHGRDFWKYLSAVFPSRTHMEIVSYYFNVFMLRKRAVQNRSYFLEIDSDDDEEPKGAHVDDDQNRSYLLEIDSENEKEQKGAHSDLYQHKPYFSDLDTYDEYNVSVFKVTRFSSYLVSREDEDSTVESFGDQDLDTGWIDDESLSKPEYNHGMSDGNVCEKDTVEMDGGRDRTSEQETMKIQEESSIDS